MSDARKYQIDMCNGPLFGKIIRFSLPLVATNIMQLMFHAADLIVVGQFAEDKNAMAAVGATAGLTALVVNVFFGLGVGINVLAARYIGARDPENLSRTIHTGVGIGIYGGTLMAVIGIIISKPMLLMMGTPPAIIGKSAIYMWIYCAGIPFLILYNFGSAVLRATGDTRRPLIYMLIAGFSNVLLNLFFVLVCKMDVAGVSLATKLSNLISAALVLGTLARANDHSKLIWKKIRLHFQTFVDVMKNGLPAGIQGSLFSVSNIVIQSSVNSFGTPAIGGVTAASSLEGIIYVSAASFYYTAISFTGQNFGAKKYSRIIRVVLLSLGCTVVSSMLVGWSILAAGEKLLGIYNPDPVVIGWGMRRLKIMATTYFLCGVMDVITGTLRGMGHSWKPLIVALTGICFFRIFWVRCLLPLNRSIEMLTWSYPASWLLVIAVNGTVLFFILRKLCRAGSE